MLLWLDLFFIIADQKKTFKTPPSLLGFFFPRKLHLFLKLIIKKKKKIWTAKMKNGCNHKKEHHFLRLYHYTYVTFR